MPKTPSVKNSGRSRSSGREAPLQAGLYGGELSCPDVARLPLVADATAGTLEVLAPGSLYQPLLLKPEDETWTISPGALNAEEKQFIEDLVRRLYPAGNPPRALGAPLKWGDKDIHLRRNLDKDPGSFRLRVDDSDWYYPDFIVWIIDHANQTQTFGFVDPKGIRSAAPGGWGDYKVVSTLYMPHVLEQMLLREGQTVIWQGEPWRFRIRGVLVSTSSYESLRGDAKFKVRDAQGSDVSLDKHGFRRGRIVFQEDRGAYIDDTLRMLIEDTPLDHVLQNAATASHPPTGFNPLSATECYLALERRRFPESDLDFAAQVLRDLLASSGIAALDGAARRRAEGELMQIATDDALIASSLKNIIGEPEKLFRLLWERNRAIPDAKPR